MQEGLAGQFITVTQRGMRPELQTGSHSCGRTGSWMPRSAGQTIQTMTPAHSIFLVTGSKPVRSLRASSSGEQVRLAAAAASAHSVAVANNMASCVW